MCSSLCGEQRNALFRAHVRAPHSALGGRERDACTTPFPGTQRPPRTLPLPRPERPRTFGHVERPRTPPHALARVARGGASTCLCARAVCSRPMSALRVAVSTAWAWGSAACAAVAVNDLLVSVALAPDDSMAPSVRAGDAVLLDRLTAKRFSYERGAAVAVRSPERPREVRLRRVLALEGDWVATPGRDDVVRVPRGHCWVESDEESERWETAASDGSTSAGYAHSEGTRALFRGRRSRVSERRSHDRALALTRMCAPAPDVADARPHTDSRAASLCPRSESPTAASVASHSQGFSGRLVPLALIEGNVGPVIWPPQRAGSFGGTKVAGSSRVVRRTYDR